MGVIECRSFRSQLTELQLVDCVKELLKQLQKQKRKKTKDTQDFETAIATGLMMSAKRKNEKLVSKVAPTFGFNWRLRQKARKKADESILPSGEIRYRPPVRKVRFDAAENCGGKDCVWNFVHDDNGATRVDSNQSKSAFVGTDESGKRIYHVCRVWENVLTDSEKYEEFLSSPQYTR